jgi:hypothetical protein
MRNLTTLRRSLAEAVELLSSASSTAATSRNYFVKGERHLTIALGQFSNCPFRCVDTVPKAIEKVQKIFCNEARADFPAKK